MVSWEKTKNRQIFKNGTSFFFLWKRKKCRFHFIPFQINFIAKKPFKRQDWKIGKAEEEQLAVAVQKYPCLYDQAIPAFHNKNMGKNKETNNDICRDITNRKEKYSLSESLNSCDSKLKMSKSLAFFSATFLWFFYSFQLTK